MTDYHCILLVHNKDFVILFHDFVMHMLYIVVIFVFLVIFSILSLPYGRPVVQAACGDHHTLALTQGINTTIS